MSTDRALISLEDNSARQLVLTKNKNDCYFVLFFIFYKPFPLENTYRLP